MFGVLLVMVQLAATLAMLYIAVALAITNPIAGLVSFGLFGLATIYVVRRVKRYWNR